MATKKITVTVPDELAEHIRKQVAEGAYESVSAYVTRAAENLRDIDPLDALIASMIAETGQPGDEASDWLDDAAEKAALAQQRSASAHDPAA